MTNKDFFQALEDLEREKNINSEQFIESLEAALTSAYKKKSFSRGVPLYQSINTKRPPPKRWSSEMLFVTLKGISN